MITILSQNRQGIFDCSMVHITPVYNHNPNVMTERGISCDFTISDYSICFKDYHLGTYNTKERAMEVLNEIAEMYRRRPSMLKPDVDRCTYPLYYEMPQDKPDNLTMFDEEEIMNEGVGLTD